MYILKAVPIIWESLHDSWNGCQCMILKEINISLSVIICSIVGNLMNISIWKKRNKHYSVLVQKCLFWKETSTYWKFKDKIFKLILTRNQQNRCFIFMWKFFPPVISHLNEWTNDSTAGFPCKISAFS